MPKNSQTGDEFLNQVDKQIANAPEFAKNITLNDETQPAPIPLVFHLIRKIVILLIFAPVSRYAIFIHLSFPGFFFYDGQ